MARRTKRRRLDRKTKASIKRTLWTLGIPTSKKRQRGLRAEEEVLQSLEYHKRKKTNFLGRIIKQVSPTLHFSQDDREGKDVIVKFQVKSQPGEEVLLPIQIQNWWSRRAQKEFNDRGICLIAVWPHEDEKKARERTFDVISKWFLRVEEVSSIS